MARPRHELAIWHTSYTSNGVAITSNYVVRADGAGNVAWSPESVSSLSYGSNANAVSTAPAGGASSSISRADHVHDLIQPVVNLGNMASSQTLDLSRGDYFAGTIVANTTFAFSNPDASGLADDFVVEVTEDGTGSHTLTWPGSVSWIGGTTPTHDGTAAGVEAYVFYTRNGGSVYRGARVGGGAIAHSSNTYSGTVTFTTPSDTLAITSPSTNTLAFLQPFADEVVTNGEDVLVWHGSDLVHDRVRLY